MLTSPVFSPCFLKYIDQIEVYISGQEASEWEGVARWRLLLPNSFDGGHWGAPTFSILDGHVQ